MIKVDGFSAQVESPRRPSWWRFWQSKQLRAVGMTPDGQQVEIGWFFSPRAARDAALAWTWKQAGRPL